MANQNLKFTISAIDKTKRVFSKITGGLAKVTKAVFSMKSAFVLAAGAAGIGLLVKKSLDAIDNLGKLSRVLGVSTKELAAFEIAAEVGGMNLEQFAKASKNVSKNVFDFLVRGTGEAVDAFKELGISQRQLRPIQNDQVAILSLIGDAFADMEDGAVKTAVAVKLFGSRAAAMLNVFETGGGDTMRQAAKDAEAFGNALDTETVRGVEKANDAMTRLKFLFQGVRDQLFGALAPVLGWLADFMRNNLVAAFEENGRGVKGWAADAALSITNFTIDSLKAFQGMIDGMIMAWNRAQLIFKGGLLNDQTKMKEIDIDISKGVAKIERLGGKVAEYEKLLDNKNLDPFSRDEIQGNIDIYIAKIDEVFLTLNALKSEKDTIEKGLGGALSKNTGFLDPMIAFLEKFRNKLVETTKDAEGLGVAVEGVLPETTIESLSKWQVAFGTALEAIKDKMAVTTETISAAWERTFTSLRDDLANFFMTGKLSFKGFMNTIKKELATLAANKLLSMLFGSLTKSGGFLSGLFNIDKRAQGGAISAGVPTLVGERGAEIIVPRNNGMVVPNDVAGKSGDNATNVVQNINIMTDVKNTVRAEIATAAPMIAELAVAAVANRNAGIR